MSQGTQVFVGAGQWTSTKKSGALHRGSGDGDWEQLTKGLPQPVSVQAITIHPTNRDVIFVGTQDGPYRSTDGGSTWERTGFPSGLQVWSITFHPRDPRVVFAGTSPVAVFRSDDGGSTWRKLPNAKQDRDRITMAFPSRVMRIAITPGHPDAIYAALEVAGVLRSVDGGETWEDCSDPLEKLAERPNLKSKIQSDSEAEGMLDAHALLVSDAAPSSVFLAVRMGLFRSDDRGKTWQDMEVGRFSPLTYGRDIRVSPQDANVLYAALSPAARSQDGSVYRSADLGRTWTRFDHGVKAHATMMSLALHPRDAAQVYCVSRCGQVFGTRDGGKSWRESPLPVDDVYAIACS
ncbi:MAG: hypothetical protein FJZ38_13970 [Candidatus Rokubacteria bacterium]|nr:hypothetical protein [Candidatus Rokubacteria bacterium]